MQLSPLAFLTPQQPPSSPLNANNSTHHHQIAFAPLPGSQPNAGLGYGFGHSKESNFNTWRSGSSSSSGVGWGQSRPQPLASTSASPFGTAGGFGSALAAGTGVGSKRRKRSESPGEDEEEGGLSMRDINLDHSLGSSPIGSRVMASGKRVRTALSSASLRDEGSMGADKKRLGGGSMSSGLNVVSQEEQQRLDLGKELGMFPLSFTSASEPHRMLTQ